MTDRKVISGYVCSLKAEANGEKCSVTGDGPTRKTARARTADKWNERIGELAAVADSTDDDRRGEPADGGSVAQAKATTQPTPGEWFVEDLDGSGEVSICYDARPFDPDSGFPSLIGSTFYDDPDCPTYGRAISYEEARANAHLIVEAVNGYASLSSEAARLRAERDRLREAMTFAYRRLADSISTQPQPFADGWDGPRDAHRALVDALYSDRPLSSTPRVETRDSPETDATR